MRQPIENTMGLSASEGDNRVTWNVGKSWCTLLCLPQQLGVEGHGQQQGLLREAGCRQIRRAGWDSPQGTESGSELQLGKITVTRGSPWVLGRCCARLWDGEHGAVSLVFCPRQVQEAQPVDTASKHVTGQEGTREWAKIYEVQIGPDQKNCFLWWNAWLWGWWGHSGY